MLLDVVKYSGIYAKVKALGSELLVEKDYHDLATCLTVKDFAEKLAQYKAYKTAIELAQETPNHSGKSRIAIERSLPMALYRDTDALYSFVTNTDERKYLEALFMRYEVGALKVLLRRMYARKNLKIMPQEYFSYLTKHIKLDFDALTASTTIDEFLDSLEGTEFQSILSKVNKADPSLFDFEMQLDYYCFIKAWNYQKKFLNKADAVIQKKILGDESDLHDIMWIYRAKKFYEIDSNLIYTYLIPIKHKLSKEIFQSLIEAESNEQFISVLDSTHYKGVFTSLEVGEMEKCFRSYMWKLHEKEQRKNPYSLSAVTAFVYKKSEELSNLTTLIECIRYSLPAETAVKKLHIYHHKDGDGND